jgi:NAD+ diphosphatase
MLTPALETEIATLAAQYGAPRRVAVELRGEPFDPLILNDRIGEICMVIRRKNGKLLTAIKTFYPPGAFRLLTGGIGHGESIEAALLREVDEETGLDVLVRRFLAVIEYQLAGGEASAERREERGSNSASRPSYAFVTFAFLLDEAGGTLGVRDPSERIGAFREVAVAELLAVAEELERVTDRFAPEIGGSWADWGRFRAVVHRVVYEAIKDVGAAPWLMH